VLVAVFIPESCKKYLASQAALGTTAVDIDGRLTPLPEPAPELSFCAKIGEMCSSVTFVGLSVTAALFMAGVRSMLSTVHKDLLL